MQGKSALSIYREWNISAGLDRELWICGLNAAAWRLFWVWESPDIYAFSVSTFFQALARSPGLLHKSGVEQNSVWVSGNCGGMPTVLVQIKSSISSRRDEHAVLTVLTLDALCRSNMLIPSGILVGIHYWPHCLVPLVTEILGTDIWFPCFSQVACGNFPVQRTRGFS